MLEIIIAAVIIIIDMVSKYLAEIFCQSPIVLIDGVAQLTYVQNRGAAWGILSNATIVLIIITFIFCGLLVWLTIRNHKNFTTLSRIIVALIFAGAVGNLIDRVLLGYVRDMIEVTFVSFPVFNIADSSIVIGTILLVIEVLFIKKNVFSVIEQDIKTLKKTKEDE
ncbi:MAG: signal peptidase II [Eubacteriales bacterium]|nr:signal peptidase II [Eubacteriales bacterium]